MWADPPLCRYTIVRLIPSLIQLITNACSAIRLLVASYLFMTGYGHFTFFYKKKDFSLHRSLGVLVRLNLLTVALCLTTGLDYLTYYFAPLVSLWYLFIYTTMYISRNISDARILAANIVFMTVLMAYITQTNGPMSKLVELVNAICQLHWNAREWSFRTSLDVCIVPAGMLTALGKILLRFRSTYR